MMTTEQSNRPLGMKKSNEIEASTVAGGLSIYDSAGLFKGSTEIGIEHAGAIYRLKITRQGKLILNK